MKEDIFESHEKLAEHVRKRKQRKRIFAFILAVTMLLTFAVPVSMMIPVSTGGKHKNTETEPPLYSAEADI